MSALSMLVYSVHLIHDDDVITLQQQSESANWDHSLICCFCSVVFIHRLTVGAVNGGGGGLRKHKCIIGID